MTRAVDWLRRRTHRNEETQVPEQKDLARTLRAAALPVTGDDASLTPLIQGCADKRFVLLGEATHGTAEFYRMRARISRRLIEEHGFAGIVAEADWPDAYRVNRYLRGIDSDTSPQEALGGFERFPLWMWRNTEMVRLLGQLRDWNDSRRAAGAPQAGFWGMDLYSLYGSVAAVLKFLDKTDPEAARRARERYDCLKPYEPDPQSYGAAAAMGGRFRGLGDASCEKQVIEQLQDLMQQRYRLAQRWQDGTSGEDEMFYIEQNARLVKNAEEYYRAMYRGGVNTWNLRDTHMADTLDALSRHLTESTGRPAKLIVWAHNSHLGDATYTEGSEREEVNVGQLMRQRHGEAAFNLGFTCNDGTVTAADNWDEPPQLKSVNAGRHDSIEGLLHQAARLDDDREGALPNFLLLPREHPDSEATAILNQRRLERAIGVIYRPETERWSHYFHAEPGKQFDALLHVDETTALQPLDPTAGFEAGHAEAPELYPSGL